MSMRRSIILILATMCISCSGPWDSPLPQPWQRDLPAEDFMREFDASGISRVSLFEAKVFVMSRKDYRQQDRDPMSYFSPVDLAVAWGDAGLEEIRDQFSVRQTFRRYSWTYRQRVDPANLPEIMQVFKDSTANWHLVPANRTVARDLEKIKKGDAVFLRGFLVNLKASNGFVMNTSLVRTDSGDGACEIFLVEEIREL